MDVLLTGANGTIGEAIIAEFGVSEDYDFTCLDINEHPERETVVADIGDYDAIRPHFDDQDAVIHLAGVPDVNGSWEDILRNNIIGTYNVLEAAADAEVPQFVFASSIHTVGIYEVNLAPDIYSEDHDLSLSPTTPVRPDSFYGVSKVFGEGLGRLYIESEENPLADLNPVYETPVRNFPKQFYSMRIKTVQGPKYDHPYGLAEEGVENGLWERDSQEYKYMVDRLKSTWFSHRDLAQLTEKCLQDKTVDFDIFWGVSGNDGHWVDLTHNQTVLGYEPEDNGAEWNSPPN